MISVVPFGLKNVQNCDSFSEPALRASRRICLGRVRPAEPIQSSVVLSWCPGVKIGPGVQMSIWVAKATPP